MHGMEIEMRDKSVVIVGWLVVFLYFGACFQSQKKMGWSYYLYGCVFPICCQFGEI